MTSAVKGAMRAKIFKNGRSQAVRLPKEFRMPGREILIRKDGDAVILEPIKMANWPRGYWDRLREARTEYEVPPMKITLRDVDTDES